jgi:hypothetical protein
MSHQEPACTGFASATALKGFAMALIALLAAPLTAQETGTASGRVVYEGTEYPMAYALAVERANEFTNAKEIAVILSDRPVTLEDVADDWIEHEAAHFTVTLDKTGKATQAVLEYSYSMVGSPDGLAFDGRIDTAAKRVVGRVTSGGVVDVLGSPLDYALELDAPLATLTPTGPPTAAERAAAESSPQHAVFRRFQEAVAADDPQAIALTISADYLERSGGEEVVQYTAGSHLPSGEVRAVRVVETGDRARLYLETDDQNGIVPCVKQDDGWRIDRQRWTYK